nr:DNA-3-methyladenine glycosylase-like isoform X3 [Physcomitrium patens]|eukprot:XP_024370694.1 DNA-3-methyladenine glycosylase-like isoform X3 [Physcomitrella patens]
MHLLALYASAGSVSLSQNCRVFALDLRRSLRVQRMSATKTTTPNRVVSPYFAKKPAGGKGLKRTMVNSAKREVKEQPEEDKDSTIFTQPQPADNYKLLSSDFYACDALDLAPRLLGKFLRHDDVILQITERHTGQVIQLATLDLVEHPAQKLWALVAWVRQFRAGGHAYVYLCYGINIMLNVVADKEGVGAAVLIRACSPVAGLATIQQRRKQAAVKPVLLTGPGGSSPGVNNRLVLPSTFLTRWARNSGWCNPRGHPCRTKSGHRLCSA